MAKKSNPKFQPLRLALVADMVIETDSELATFFSSLLDQVNNNGKFFNKAKGDLKELGRLLKLASDETDLRDLICDELSLDTMRRFIAKASFDLTRLKREQALSVVRYLSVLLDDYQDADVFREDTPHTARAWLNSKVCPLHTWKVIASGNWKDQL